MTHWTIDLAWQYLPTRSLISMLGSFWARNFNCKKHINVYIRIHFKSSRSWNFLICFIFYNSYFFNIGTRILFLSCGWVRRWSPLILVPRATQINLQPTSGAPCFKTMWPKKRRALWRRVISTKGLLHRLYTRPHRGFSFSSVVNDVITSSLHSQLVFSHRPLYKDVWMKNVRTIKFHAKWSRTSIFSWRLGLSTREDAKSKWRYIYWPQPLSLCCFF